MLPIRFYCVQHPTAPVGLDGAAFLKALSAVAPTLAIGIGGGYLDVPPWSELRPCFQRLELAGMTSGFINVVSCMPHYAFGGAMRQASPERGTKALKVPASTAYSALYTEGVTNVAIVSGPLQGPPEEALGRYEAIWCRSPKTADQLCREFKLGSVCFEPNAKNIEYLLENIVSNNTKQENKS